MGEKARDLGECSKLFYLRNRVGMLIDRDLKKMILEVKIKRMIRLQWLRLYYR